jgi:isopentenyldiphosphate isomerase
MSVMQTEELFDIYDDNMNFLGVKSRSRVHRDGDWHRSFHCWVIYRHGSGEDYIMIQRRAPDKDTYPNYLDLSVGGHLSAGETLEQAVREIDEELGLHVDFSDLIPVGLRVTASKPSPETTDREFNHIFFLVHEQPLENYAPNEEVSGLAIFRIDDGLALFAGETDTITVQYAHYRPFSQETLSLTLKDFVPVRDHYWYRALVAAKRCLNGEKYLIV